MAASLSQKISANLEQPGLRRLLAIAALGLLAAWLIWLQDTTQAPPQASLPREHGEPDAYLEGAVLKRFNAQGRHFQTLEGQVVTHYPDSNLALVALPRVYHWTQEGQLWLLVAQKGEMSDGSVLYLEGDVSLQSLEASSPWAHRFNTQRLWLNNLTETAATPDPAEFVSAAGHTQGVGLIANLDQSSVELLNQVTSLYQVVAPPQQPQEQEPD